MWLFLGTENIQVRHSFLPTSSGRYHRSYLYPSSFFLCHFQIWMIEGSPENQIRSVSISVCSHMRLTAGDCLHQTSWCDGLSGGWGLDGASTPYSCLVRLLQRHLAVLMALILIQAHLNFEQAHCQDKICVKTKTIFVCVFTHTALFETLEKVSKLFMCGLLD